MPTRVPSPTVQAWTRAWWPTVTSSPMTVGLSSSVWMTELSWIFDRAPIRIDPTSARITTP